MTTHPKDFFVAARVPLVRSVGLYENFFKRFFDIAFVVFTAPIALLIIGISALIVALDGHCAFYTQDRVGRGGRVFRLLKIRTMVPDADARLSEYLAGNMAARVEWETSQKLKRDPRITTFGRLLRKSSLDELPQLWNVLRGDMSIVGPRPMMVDQKSLYPGSAYYELRPGITGPWQVSDRNDSTFAARAKFDSEYCNNLSLRTDLSILVRTVSAVLRCTGH